MTLLDRKDCDDADRTIPDRFRDAMEGLDADLLADIYAEEVVVWHSHDEIEQSRDEAVATARAFLATLGRCKVERSALLRTETGFVQQHRLVGERVDGRPFRSAPLCIVVTVSQGKITRIDEYIGLKPPAA